MTFYELLFILPPALEIIIISIILTLITTLIYKYTTDQKALKEIHEETKRLREEAKQHQKEGNTDKAMQVQKQMMAISGKQLSHTLKPTFITLIPVLLVFTLLQGAYNLTPFETGNINVTTIYTNEQIAQQNNTIITTLEFIGKNTYGTNVQYTFNATKTGEYPLRIVSGSDNINMNIIISKTHQAVKPTINLNGAQIKSATINYPTLKVFKMPIVNWQISWFWTYIIISLIGSMTLRKMMKVY